MFISDSMASGHVVFLTFMPLGTKHTQHGHSHGRHPPVQRGTPDLDLNDSDPASPNDPFARLARRLHVNERAAVHWDDSELDRALVMRPLENDTCTRHAG